jgi:hypothetical protein
VEQGERRGGGLSGNEAEGSDGEKARKREKQKQDKKARGSRAKTSIILWDGANWNQECVFSMTKVSVPVYPRLMGHREEIHRRADDGGAMGRILTNEVGKVDKKGSFLG